MGKTRGFKAFNEHQGVSRGFHGCLREATRRNRCFRVFKEVKPFYPGSWESGSWESGSQMGVSGFQKGSKPFGVDLDYFWWFQRAFENSCRRLPGAFKMFQRGFSVSKYFRSFLFLFLPKQFQGIRLYQGGVSLGFIQFQGRFEWVLKFSGCF